MFEYIYMGRYICQESLRWGRFRFLGWPWVLCSLLFALLCVCFLVVCLYTCLIVFNLAMGVLLMSNLPGRINT